MEVRKYKTEDIAEMAEIWNEVVRDGVAFPQENVLDEKGAAEFFAAQSYCGVASENGKLYGLYILHPNNVGRCGHICNSSYAVRSDSRGKHIGRALVLHSIKTGADLGFKILQFNAVVESNIYARRLYESLGFTPLGVIPRGFRLCDGSYENIVPYYIELDK